MRAVRTATEQAVWEDRIIDAMVRELEDAERLFVHRSIWKWSAARKALLRAFLAGTAASLRRSEPVSPDLSQLSSARDATE